MGCFAVEQIQAGRWICQYEGTLVESPDDAAPFDPLGIFPSPTRHEVHESADLIGSDYVFELAPGLYIDAQNSSHFSRFFNHRQEGNLDVAIDVEQRQIDFYAKCAIAAGDELTFDCERHDLNHSMGPGLGASSCAACP